MARAKHPVASAPPRSIYRKIRHVLEESRLEKATDVEDLRNRVLSRGDIDFTYFALQKGSQDKTPQCKPEAVDRIVDIAVELGLLKRETARLTENGLRAVTGPDGYAGAIREAIKRVLRQKDLPWEGLHGAIGDILAKSRGRVLPTWDVIYTRVSLSPDKLPADTFRMYLGLLSTSGGIAYSQRKIYLP